MRKSLPLILFFAVFSSYGQLIPDSMRVDWTKTGLQNPAPDFSTIADVTNYGAVADDSIDDYTAVQSAIASFGGGEGVIYFPPGTYRIHNTIGLTDSIIIRGAGSDSTTLSFNFNGGAFNSFNIGYSQSQPFTIVISGYEKGSRRLVLGAPNNFVAGDDIELREMNGSWDIEPISWADYSVGHLATVDSVSGDTIWMDEPLRMDFDSVLQPEVRKVTMAKHSGLECFKMERADTSSAGISYGAYFSYAKNCWMRGIESDRSICAHVALEASAHISISGCYFHHAYLYDGVGTRGYGVVMFTHSCANRVEDNIFKHLRHAMILKQGANGNVFSYNYSIEPFRSEPIPDYAADMCMHGHYAFANLFEGNIGQNLQIDIVWGPSGPFNTFFRNKVELYGILMSSGSVQSDRQNFVGNDVSSSQFLQGNYSLAGGGHFQWGNNVRGTITPAGTGTVNDTSYCLTSIPPFFWNLSQPLPAVGLPNSFATDNNPARQRYLEGGPYTRCGYVAYVDTTPPSNIHQHPLTDSDGYWAQLQKDKVVLGYTSSKTEQLHLEIMALDGKFVYSNSFEVVDGYRQYQFAMPHPLAPAIYLARLWSNDTSHTFRLWPRNE